jgi:hypothetical protein
MRLWPYYPNASSGSYLPLTRTRRKLLTCGLAKSWHSSALGMLPRPGTKHQWTPRDRLDERNIVELITAYCDGTTAASVATTHGLSLKSSSAVASLPYVTSPSVRVEPGN